MSSALEEIRNNYGMAGEEVANMVDALEGENAALKAELKSAEEKQGFCFACGNPITDPCDVTKLKAELAAWKNVFGHLGTADECGNEWIALQDKLADAKKLLSSIRQAMSNDMADMRYMIGTDWSHMIEAIDKELAKS